MMMAVTVLCGYAQWPEGDVTLVSQSGGEVTVRSIYTAAKGANPVTEAQVAAFNVIMTRGIEGLHNGQPMLEGDVKSFLYRFFHENIYVRYMAGQAAKESEQKIQGMKQVTVRVTIRLDALVKYAQGTGMTLNPAWNAGGKGQVKATASLNPKVAVIPYVKGSGDDGYAALKDIMDNDPAKAYAVDAIGAEFSKRGYKTVDFRQVLANSRTSDILNEDVQDDLVSMVLRQLPSDIAVIVDLSIVPGVRNSNSCTVNIRAVETQTAGALANATYAGNPYMTSDGVLLAKEALKNVKDSFFTDLKGAFDRMVKNGRAMQLEFNLGPDVADWDFDEPTPVTDNDFRDVLEEFLQQTSCGGVYNMGTSSAKFINADINIPIWDEEKGRGYTTSNFARDLRRMLKREIGDAYKPEVVEMGQKLRITIK